MCIADVVCIHPQFVLETQEEILGEKKTEQNQNW